MKKFLSLFFGGLFLITSIPTYAVTLQVGENFEIKETLLDDAYVMAAKADIDADINGDLYITGGQVTVNGNILEDLVVGGGKVTVNGNVTGDIRVLGGQIMINGNVGDDVVGAGGQIDISRDSVIGGSVLAGTGVLTIDGKVLEDVRGGIGAFILNGVVERNIMITVEDTIDIDENAYIGGNLKYSALIEGNVPSGVVKGETSFNAFEKENVVEELTYFFLLEKFVNFLAAVLLMVFMVLLMPKMLINGGKLANENVLRSFGIGLLTVIAAFIGFIILMITIVGIPFALILMSLMIIVVYLAKIFTCAWIGSYFLNYKRKVSVTKLFSVLTLILFAYYLVGMIPFIGWIINIALFLIGVGTVVVTKLDYFKMMKKKKLI